MKFAPLPLPTGEGDLVGGCRPRFPPTPPAEDFGELRPPCLTSNFQDIFSIMVSVSYQTEPPDESGGSASFSYSQ